MDALNFLNALDVVLLVVVVLSALFAVLRGFLREVVGLLGWLVGFAVASRFSVDVGELFVWVRPTFQEPVGFFLIFSGVLFAFGFLGQLLKRWITPSDFSVVDRFFGLVFGLARGLLILMIAFSVMHRFEKEMPALVKGSFLAPRIIQANSRIVPLLPKAWRVDLLPSVSPAFETLPIKKLLPLRP